MAIFDGLFGDVEGGLHHQRLAGAQQQGLSNILQPGERITTTGASAAPSRSGGLMGQGVYNSPSQMQQMQTRVISEEEYEALKNGKAAVQETNELLRNTTKLNKMRMNDMADFIKALDTPEGKELLAKLELD